MHDKQNTDMYRQVDAAMIPFNVCLMWEMWEALWPNGKCAELRSELSRLEPWTGSMCCFLGQDIYVYINGYRRI